VKGLTPRIIDSLARLIDPDERDAVQGDFAELRTPDHQALWELLGLVVRRRLQVWADWHAWFALLGVTIPLGLLLSLVSRNWSNTTSIYAWFYVNNWTWAYLGTPVPAWIWRRRLEWSASGVSRSH
jgi:hypothetical protein